MSDLSLTSSSASVMSPEEAMARLSELRRDPVAFLRAVRTRDEVDKSNPIKAFPIDRFEYLKLYSRLWARERFIGVPKSRRMMMSWTNVALYVWDTMFNPGRANAFVSKKEDDSDELVRRARFIVENLDTTIIPKEFIPAHEYKFGKLSFPEIESSIQGFASGADQLRQYTFSGILADEMAFWENAQKMYAASFPTLEGGGRFSAVSSPGPGFFRALIFDALDSYAGGVSDGAMSAGTLKHNPAPGVEIWRNPANGFVIFQLHFTANPDKRDPDYITAVRGAMPRAQFEQEYNLQWDSFSGLPVYQDFDDVRHLTKEKPRPESGLPLLRGWDFGLTPACVVAQLQGSTLVVLREFTAQNMGAERFVDLVLPQIRALYPAWSDQRRDWYDFIDPAGEFRKDTDEGTCAMVLDSRGLSPIPGPVAFEARRKAVEAFLIKRTRDGESFQIYKDECPVTYRGFKGGYRFPEKALDVEPSKLRPIKDEHSHPHDALQYICAAITGMKRRSDRPVPQLAYFNHERSVS